RLQEQGACEDRRRDDQQDRQEPQEQRPLEARVGAQIVVDLAHARSPTVPVFSVFSHTISAWRSSLMYAAAGIAHSSGPYPTTYTSGATSGRRRVPSSSRSSHAAIIDSDTQA